MVFRSECDELIDEVRRHRARWRKCLQARGYANFLNEMLKARGPRDLHEPGRSGAFYPECVRNAFGQEDVAVSFHNGLPVTTTETYASIEYPE